MRTHGMLCILVVFCLLLPLTMRARIIHIPAEQHTIQAGINVAVNGDTVLVSAGTYFERINFNGKAITVRSSSGPEVTIIDGAGSGTVVTFGSGEGRRSVIQGFTIRNGSAPSMGGGIYACCGTGASPSIIGNVITSNNSEAQGGGIYNIAGAPLIRDNIITNNLSRDGAAIYIENGSGDTQILGNTIQNNTGTVGVGGILIRQPFPGTPIIEGNLITGNVASSAASGGGIAAFGSYFRIVQNVITGNRAYTGGGILLSAGPNGSNLFVNNTIVGNLTRAGASAVYLFGTNSQDQFFNNLLIGMLGQSAVYCDPSLDQNPPNFVTNDAFSQNSTGLTGTCAAEGNVNGNISTDPKFLDSRHGNFQLLGGSPAIDVGSNSAPNLPALDFIGNPRIINGNNGPQAIVDMGAYEFIPVAPNPATLAFGPHLLGTHTPETVTLRNNLNQTLSITGISITGDYSFSSSCGSTLPPRTACDIIVTFTPTMIGRRVGTLTISDIAGNSPQAVRLSGIGE